MRKEKKKSTNKEKKKLYEQMANMFKEEIPTFKSKSYPHLDRSFLPSLHINTTLKNKTNNKEYTTKEYTVKEYSKVHKEVKEYSKEKLKKRILTLKNFLFSPDRIANHAFYPFIGFNITKRKSGAINKIKYYEALTKKLKGKDKEKCLKLLNELKEKGLKKIRPIRYSSHIDGHIYSHYANILNKHYEEKIKAHNLEKEILAYRSSTQSTRNKKETKTNNYTMANEVFMHIKKKENKCLALVFDISGFYDHIDHKNLYKEWCNILNMEKLPADHLNIFKSLTKYCFIDLKEICLYIEETKKKKSVLNENTLNENKLNESTLDKFNESTLDKNTFNKLNKSTLNENKLNESTFNKCTFEKCSNCKKKIRKKIPKVLFRNIKEFKQFKLWYKTTYEKTQHKKFHKNPGFQEKHPHGIPQGSSISTLLSNIYMLPFDIEMKKLADNINGIYRRYCDDIVFICPADKKTKDEVEKRIKEGIKSRGEYLFIHPIDEWNKYSKSQCYDFTNTEKIKQRPMQYLGFYYDGKQIRIREESLNRYMRKSKRAVNAMKKSAIKKLKNMHKKGILPYKTNKANYTETNYMNYIHTEEKETSYPMQKNLLKIHLTLLQSKNKYESMKKG